MNNFQIDNAKWQSMTLFEQMGNIGSEVGRALSAKRQGNELRMQGAFQRGLDLIDITIKQWTIQKSPRTKELLRAREQFVQSINTDNVDATLEKYFMEFAIAARLNK